MTNAGLLWKRYPQDPHIENGAGGYGSSGQKESTACYIRFEIVEAAWGPGIRKTAGEEHSNREGKENGGLHKVAAQQRWEYHFSKQQAEQVKMAQYLDWSGGTGDPTV